MPEGAPLSSPESQPSISELRDRNLTVARAVRAAHRELYGDGLPFDMFPAHWAFVGPTDLSREEFEAAVRRQYEEWQAEEPQPDWQPWDSCEVVVQCGRVVILYESQSIGQNSGWHVADLRSEYDRFTAGELMYAFYRAASAYLAGGDHQAFQGFEFVALLESYPERVPLYRAVLGG